LLASVNVLTPDAAVRLSDIAASVVIGPAESARAALQLGASFAVAPARTNVLFSVLDVPSLKVQRSSCPDFAKDAAAVGALPARRIQDVYCGGRVSVSLRIPSLTVNVPPRRCPTSCAARRSIADSPQN
jgi:hypothetical protein